MSRNSIWKLVLVVVVVGWSFIEMNPPVARDLGNTFEKLAEESRKDATFTNIVGKYRELQAKEPQRSFANLVDAVGTNVITNYFDPGKFNVANERDPTRAVLNMVQRKSLGKIKLGLDLQGGVSFLVVMDTTNYLASHTNEVDKTYLQQQALSQAVDVMSKRVNRFGVAEPVIQAQGDNAILIQLPGLSDADMIEARKTISNIAFLEFKMVHESSQQLIAEGTANLPGYQILQEQKVGRDGTVSYTPLLVRKKAEMTGDYVVNAFVGRDMAGQAEIRFKLNSDGKDLFASITRENIGRRLAIILDGELKSAPVIQGAIEGGDGVITGNFTDKEAFDLANVLQNPLKVPVRIDSETKVGPTLGNDTIKSGVRSAIYGTIAVAAFMLIYYLFAGFVANVALITNIIILLGVMCYIQATFTLPGIAGVVLTVGMAVDANVLIFERIREELAKGKSLRGALAAGYDRAFGTIFDSHVTTLISSIILIYMGSGPIKGFGVTLTIGVAASLFTALIVTRIIFDFLIGRGWLKTLPMLHVIRSAKLDFMKLAKPAFALSWAIILLGIGYGLFVRGDKMLGIDFKGGDNLTIAYKQKVETEKVREALHTAGISEPVIQYQQGDTLTITSPLNTADKVLQTLTNSFPSAGFDTDRMSVNVVGPTIGEEIRNTAIIASILSLLGIFVYVAFRYEASFAVGAVVAIVHDVLMTIGWYCLTGLWGEGRQFNATTVAALLTIIGFSINDTIVIFDRIREDLKLGVRGSFRELINQALNQTLSRTIITSGTVFIATMSLYLFGGGAINDFAFTFLVGIITGTYSSIYIASALVLWWHKGVRPRTGAHVTMEPATSASRA